jgi:transposase-like protein
MKMIVKEIVFVMIIGTLMYSCNIENVICEIHNQKMYKKKIAIHYGFVPMFILSESCPDLASKYFPHSNDSINRGCVIGEVYFEKYVCKECNKTRDKYEKNCGKS